MKPYDANINYLGPNASSIGKYVPKYPVGIPELRDAWNYVAYLHDVDFSGDDYAGFFGWMKKIYNRKEVLHEIEVSNRRLYRGLIEAITEIREELSDAQVYRAEFYALLVFQAVDAFGWAFYKVGNN
jgi:hypothetical protein